jgi:hypothetical protein
MDIFDLSLLERAESVEAERDSVEIVVNGVTITYRKYLDGFDAVLDIDLDGASFYRNHCPVTDKELAAAKKFFVRAADEVYDRKKAARGSAGEKLKIVFGEPATC